MAEPRCSRRESMMTMLPSGTANRTAGAAHVGQLALRAELMLLRRAYAHHYDEYGVGLEEMQQAVGEVRTVVEDYSKLLPPSLVHA